MIKNKILSVFALITASTPLLSQGVRAESTPEDVQAASGSDETVMLVIACVLVALAVVSVVLVNRRTKKYRQAFKRQKKKNKKIK